MLYLDSNLQSYTKLQTYLPIQIKKKQKAMFFHGKSVPKHWQWSRQKGTAHPSCLQINSQTCQISLTKNKAIFVLFKKKY